MRIETVGEFLARGGHVEHLPVEARGERPSGWGTTFKGFDVGKLTWAREVIKSSQEFECVCYDRVRKKGRETWAGRNEKGRVVRRVCSEVCKARWLAEQEGRG